MKKTLTALATIMALTGTAPRLTCACRGGVATAATL